MPFTVNRRFQGLYTGLLAAHLKGDELERGGLAPQRATPNIRRFSHWQRNTGSDWQISAADAMETPD